MNKDRDQRLNVPGQFLVFFSSTEVHYVCVYPSEYVYGALQRFFIIPRMASAISFPGLSVQLIRKKKKSIFPFTILRMV